MRGLRLALSVLHWVSAHDASREPWALLASVARFSVLVWCRLGFRVLVGILTVRSKGRASPVRFLGFVCYPGFAVLLAVGERRAP